LTSSIDAKTLVLLKAIRGGNQDAWRKLYDRYHGYLHYVVTMRLVGSPQRGFEAEDVLQEAFLSAWKRIERFEYRGEGSFLAWLTRIVVNQLQNQRRSGGRREEGLETSAFRRATPPDGTATPSEALIKAEAQERLRLAFEKLGEADQMILGLRLGQGLTWGDIGVIMETSRALAAQNFARAIDRMRRDTEDPRSDDS